MFKIETIKTHLKSISWSDINLYSSILLKITSILFLLFLAASLVSIKLQFSHSGPSCDSYKSDFQYWLNNQGEKKSRVLSVETSRVQLQNGTTKCFGTLEDEEGNYKSWSGEVTQLDDGGIIGKAN
ncbi:hypothetical protein PS1M3_37430 [Pseudoalteromonas sp. PS1M3]|jgi:hypothetical protein|uniref:hypothetical protein n=1 Tax=unclassified Pseudoalteromonas TaxID=194690 RepID=UPI0006D65138|nr:MULTISPECIES: hypothetical protein [unclassified Pseudoalteromonas]KPV90406.1 hypothetical protein AN395_03232 [Pseudoalteromonas sp. P1-30]BBW93656.1 hypothetical protein PS1M3_37430 [Pseudoalteromonas sp. PS1M3]